MPFLSCLFLPFLSMPLNHRFSSPCMPPSPNAGYDIELFAEVGADLDCITSGGLPLQLLWVHSLEQHLMRCVSNDCDTS